MFAQVGQNCIEISDIFDKSECVCGGAPARLKASQKKGDRMSKDELDEEKKIQYHTYKGEEELEMIKEMIQKDLSEPYSIFTYRYFISGWPDLCYLVILNLEGPSVCVCVMHGLSRTRFTIQLPHSAKKKEFRAT